MLEDIICFLAACAFFVLMVAVGVGLGLALYNGYFYRIQYLIF